MFFVRYSIYDMLNILYFGGGGEEDSFFGKIFSMHPYLLILFSEKIILCNKELEKIKIFLFFSTLKII